ncbi:DgyrCDS9998 [Dimorphilus gyrociliatus]|uniref:DgyrCDS9998 n=1 Tax=Dimorphilus gyrociliatus TaxID=2664684 RepID=A0A7I8W0Y2_9ANNE|nr:DgyrCDS9998 [Dimorphilus gyrociliatus]
MTSPNNSPTNPTEKEVESAEKKSRFLPYQEGHSKKRLCNRESDNSEEENDNQVNVNLPDSELKNLDIASESQNEDIFPNLPFCLQQDGEENNADSRSESTMPSPGREEHDEDVDDEREDSQLSTSSLDTDRPLFLKEIRSKRRKLLIPSETTSSEHSDDSDSDDSNDSDSRITDSSPASVENDILKSQRISKSLDRQSIVNKYNLTELIFCKETGVKKAKTFSRDVISLQHNITRLSKYGLLDEHNGCVNALHFNETGTLIASGSDDMNIILWDWERLKPYVIYGSGHEANVFQCKFLPASNDSVIISAARDGQIRIADISSSGTCKGTRRLARHEGPAHRITLFHDSCHEFLTCGEDGLVYQIDCREPKPVKLLIVKEESKLMPLYSIHANPMNSNEFCVGGKDPYIRVFDRRKIKRSNKVLSPDPIKKYCPHHLTKKDRANVTCACYNYDGSEILGTYNDDDIYLFNNNHSDGDDFKHRYSGHRNNQTVKGVNFYGQRNEYIVSGSDCGNIFFWEKESEAIVSYFKGDNGGVVNVLEPHPTLPVLATSGLDNDVKLWMPNPSEDNSLEDLEVLMDNNWDDRKADKRLMPYADDESMIRHLMRTLSQRRTTADDSSRDWNITDDGDDSHQIQCAPQ